jgi:hypothetical protein
MTIIVGGIFINEKNINHENNLKRVRHNYFEAQKERLRLDVEMLISRIKVRNNEAKKQAADRLWA